jgi:photosystem II stability/assembly factor-like uncharacterized protein
MNKAIGIAFSLLVFLTAAYAFAPRPPPRFPPRETAVDTLLLLDAARAGERLVAVGERGHIVFSDDAGATWREAASPTQATLTSLYFVDAQNGWAVGHDSVILRSRDGGASWRLAFSAPDWQKPLLKVWFRDARQGFAIGAYGLFLQTHDGGASWQPRGIAPGDRHLNAMAALKNQHDGKLLIAGEAGLLLRSTDDGQTWQALASPYQGSFFGILPLRDGAVLVYGLRGKVFRSADAGATWAALDTGTHDALQGGALLADGGVMLAGQSGAVLISRDQGKTFQLQHQPDRRCVAAIHASGNAVLLFGESGVMHFGLP